MTEGDFHTSVQAYYRQNYLEAIDLVVHCIKNRFEQPGYAVYRNLEQLLLKASEMADTNSEFDFVCSLICSQKFFKPNY